MLFIPFTAATMAARWSMIRSRGHYPSDILVGGVVGIAVALAAWKLWPPAGQADVLAGTTGERRRHQQG